MLDTLQSRAEQNEKIEMQRIKSNREVEEKRMALEHEREMAKIKLEEARLKLEQDKLRMRMGAQFGAGGDDDTDMA